MTPRTFCQQGNQEIVKGVVHCATATLLAVMATYNAIAWLYRRDRHLAINTALYSFGLCLEAKKTINHWTSPP